MSTFIQRRGLNWSPQEGHFCCGYNETSNAYKVYIPRQRKITVSRDVRFEEGRAFRRSHGINPVVTENREREAPSRTFKQSGSPARFSSYLALTSSISESEPSTFEEAPN